MKKIIMLFLCTVLLTLTSCGQSVDTDLEPTVTPVAKENPSDEAGEMTDDSSTVIIDKNTRSIESGVEGGTEGGDLPL